MMYLLERFLKPFRILLAFHVIEHTELGNEEASSIPPTTSVINASVETTGISTVATTAISTASGMSLSTGPDSKVRVSWVYNLSKNQVQDELRKLGAPTEGNADQLRADLVRLLRQGSVRSVPVTIDTAETLRRGSDGRVRPLEFESDSIREMLGLPPTADFADVKCLLTSTLSARPIAPVPQGSPVLRQGLPAGNSQANLEYQPLGNIHSGDCRGHDPVTTRGFSPQPYRISTSEVVYTPQRQDFHQRLRYETDHVPRPTRYPEDSGNNAQLSSAYNPESVRFSNTATLCSMVRKWNLRFDGKRDADAISFLERLHELMESYEVSPDLMLKALPELLKDSALLWHRNNRDFWAVFSDFLRDFQAQYLPTGYLLHLDDEIRKRTQGEGEVFRQYVVAITTLIRRRGGFSESEKIDRIYSNMHPNYKTYIRRRDFVNLSSLMKVAEEYEANLREKLNYRPPPGPAQALVPETAFQGRSKPNFKTPYYASMVNAENERDADKTRLDNKDFQRRTQTVTFKDYTPSAGTGSPRTSRSPNTESMKQLHPRQSDKTWEKPAAPKVCWNCDRIGHLYRECRRPRTLRCFNCKKAGIRTTECGCLNPENEARTTERGGRRSPSPAHFQRPPTSS